jgi:hypothetical protein
MLSVVVGAASSVPWFRFDFSTAQTPKKIFGKFFESGLWQQIATTARVPPRSLTVIRVKSIS